MSKRYASLIGSIKMKSTVILRHFFVRGVDFLPLSVRQLVHHLPVVAWMQRKLFVALTEGFPCAEIYTITAGPAKGLRLALHLPRDKVFWLGTYELKVCEWLIKHLQKDEICWDIGGYTGYFSAIMSRQSGQPVYCFEPLPMNRKLIRKQSELNSNVQIVVVPCALGSNDGYADFLIMPEPSMGKLAISTFQKDASPEKKVKVPVTTIDEVVKSRKVPPPNLLKIDVEGAEFQVLLGGEQILREYRPKILLEIHGCTEDIKLFELLAKYRYSCTIIETNKLLKEGNYPMSGNHLWCVSMHKKFSVSGI